jgi:hypothetical protein
VRGLRFGVVVAGAAIALLAAATGRVPGSAVPVPGFVPAANSTIRPATVGPGATAGRQWLRPGTSWQWQIDGNAIDETVLDHVSNRLKMYDVDLETTPATTIARLRAKGIYVVCYMETGGWEPYRSDADAFPARVRGAPVDGYPQERYLDIRQRAVLVPIMAARMDRARAKGCHGIEPDLDDTYTSTTGFPLTMADQVAYNTAIAALAHARSMSIGLKNGASPGGVFERAMVGITDWALNESCNQFDECAGYAVFVAQHKPVFQVEYIDEGATTVSFCPADNAANYDGLLKASSSSLGAQPRKACRLG